MVGDRFGEPCWAGRRSAIARTLVVDREGNEEHGGGRQRRDEAPAPSNPPRRLLPRGWRPQRGEAALPARVARMLRAAGARGRLSAGPLPRLRARTGSRRPRACDVLLKLR